MWIILQPYDRIEQSNVVSRRDADVYTKSLPQKITYKWKGEQYSSLKYSSIYGKPINKIYLIVDGCVVDPECGLEDNARVYCQKQQGREIKYSVNLVLVNIEDDKNSYYRMQLLQSNEHKL